VAHIERPLPIRLIPLALLSSRGGAGLEAHSHGDPTALAAQLLEDVVARLAAPGELLAGGLDAPTASDELLDIGLDLVEERAITGRKPLDLLQRPLCNAASMSAFGATAQGSYV